ncbi:hypothetical protein AB4Z48_38200 [Cupriavidus sp. 2TAF22]|uniref:hypothetical protein n=1 Tax=unclassified Cupriavidus TaxID=2640874 RepID=UPI003F931FE7
MTHAQQSGQWQAAVCSLLSKQLGQDAEEYVVEAFVKKGVAIAGIRRKRDGHWHRHTIGHAVADKAQQEASIELAFEALHKALQADKGAMRNWVTQAQLGDLVGKKMTETHV